MDSFVLSFYNASDANYNYIWYSCDESAEEELLAKTTIRFIQIRPIGVNK